MITVAVVSLATLAVVGMYAVEFRARRQARAFAMARHQRRGERERIMDARNAVALASL